MTELDETLRDDTAMAEWREQIAPLEDACRKTQQLLDNIEAPLADLYAQAEAAGDETVINEITVAWKNAQQLGGLIPSFTAALTTGAAITQALHTQRNAIAEELDTLLQSLDRFHTGDPRLREFVVRLEEDVREELEGDYWDYVGEAVYEGYNEEFHIQLMTHFNTSHMAIGSLIAALRGDGSFDPRQESIVQELLDSFSSESPL